MILHSLRVTHWRSLLHPTEVGPFAEGLNVIHAPNGTGKSSLFEALRRTLFDAHLVTGNEIDSVRSWGRSLAPQVMADFSQGKVRYRIEKAFLDGPTARLLRFEDGHFAPLADGRNADSKLREILAVTDAPGRGLSKQEHWGVAQALWAPQGALSLKSLSPTLSENLRAALGVQLTGEGGSRLEELIEEQYLSFFTKGGKPRAGKDASPISGLELELTKTDQERQRLFAQQQSFEEASRAVEDARQRRAQARREADALKEPLLETRRQAETWQRLQAELEQKRQTEQIAQERFESAGRAIDSIAKARREVAEWTIQAQREGTRLGELGLEFKVAGELTGRLRGQRDEARQKRAALNQPAAEVEEARAFLSESKDRRTLSLRLEKLQPIQTALSTERNSRSALVAPDDKTIRDIRKHLAARQAAETTLQASLIRLTIRPRQEARVTGKSAGEVKSIPAGQEETFAGSPEVSLEIEGFGGVTATGPGRDVEGLREEMAEAGKKAAKLAQPYGVQDPDRLQLLRDQAVELDQKIRILEKETEGILAEETVEDLRGRMSKLNAGLLERTQRFPAWQDRPPVVSDLQSALERRRHEIEEQVGKAEDACDQARAAEEAVGKRHAQTEAGAKNAGLNLEAAAARLAELTKDGLPDEVRQTARREMATVWEAARSQARDCGAKLAEIGDNPQKSVEKLESRHRALEQLESTARDCENKAEGRLQALAAEGSYSKLAACEERLADLNAGLRRERLRLEALRLLHDTVAKCKADAVAAVAAPVERAVTRMLARVAGPRLGTVRLTDHFVPAGLLPEGLAEAVELDNLSGGEQEQLFLLSRLALGQVLAKNERQLVVLDDVLNATDTARLARLLTILEEASSQLQIIILTCHPERYRALENASFFDLISASAAP